MKKFSFLLGFIFLLGFTPSEFSYGFNVYPVEICGYLSFDKEQETYVMHPFAGPREEPLRKSIFIDDGYESFSFDLRQHFKDGPSVRPFCVQGYLKKDGRFLGFKGFYFLDRSGFSVGN